MSVVGTVRVTCPGCGLAQDFRLVQSINTRTDAEAKRKLIAGELNVARCACGKVTQLDANVLFHDPDAEYYCRLCPGDERDLAEAEALFLASGATGRLRLVRSLNALIEKVKLLDAGLDDWAIEITKVLLLATVGDLERVLLFDWLDRDGELVHWLLFDPDGGAPRTLASPLSGYARIAARAASRPSPRELRIDRAWAIAAAEAMITAAN
jgi:hypothetical protein